MKKILISFLVFMLLLSVSCSNKSNEIEQNHTSSIPEKAQTSYRDALSDEELNLTKELAIDYYSKTVWKLISIDFISDDYHMYKNNGIEDKYKPGEIIIYYVVAERDNEVFDMSISIAKVNGEWKVINNGYKLYD